MMKPFLTTAVLTIALSMSQLVSAENRFCLGGETDHLDAAGKQACAAQVKSAKKLVSQHPGVDNWHFVVVCGESSWSDYALFAHDNASSLREASLDISYTDRTIYLRGDRLSAEPTKADPKLSMALVALSSDSRTGTTQGAE
jgi:hypothetical protein